MIPTTTTRNYPDSIHTIIQMCGISAIYILDKKGRVLIARHFRPDLPVNIYDIFNKKILEYDEHTLKYPSIKIQTNHPRQREQSILFPQT